MQRCAHSWTNSTTPTDTDADGLPDVWEMLYFTNLTQTLTGDPDADLVSNGDEFLHGEHPNQPGEIGDQDQDGLPDDWELTYFGSLAQSALDDCDNDDFSNLQELGDSGAAFIRLTLSIDSVRHDV